LISSLRFRAALAAVVLPCALAATIAIVGAPLARAQLGASPEPGTGTGTDVMQVFRSMSQTQQQQILQQLGLGGGALGGGNGALGGIGAGTSSLTTERLEDVAAERLRLQRRQQEQLEDRLPILRPQDWVVIEVDTRPLRPRPSDTTATLYQALTSGTAGTTGGLGGQLGQQSQLSPAQMQQLQALLEQQSISQATSQGDLQTAPGQQSQNQGGQGTQSVPSGANQTNQAPFSEGWQNGPPSLLSTRDPQVLAQLTALIRSRNPYQLTRDGVLVLPGFTGIPLDGLNETQATLRLEVEPALRGLYFRVTRLPLKKTGIEGLKPFGYDIFDNPPSTFAPITNVPVPADYVLGPGDELEVQLYGNQNRTFALEVGRNGQVSFPELGPINVGGQRFIDVKESLEQRVARQMIGVKASVSMGETRAIRVFVLGEAQDPGSYAVSGLASITSALYASGGIKPAGSLRQIELKRDGRLIRHLDLYDLLIRGDTTDDTRLLPGDVIFIPAVGPTVSVEGEVHRPAIYEIKGKATVGDLLQLAGGLTPDADSDVAWLTRIDPQRERVVLRVDLTSPAGLAMPLRNGDELRVTRLRPTLDSGVVLEGHIYSPGTVAYRPGLRLTDVIHSVDNLKPNADLHYVLVRRELPPDRRITAFSVDLGAALLHPGGKADVPLMPRDRVMVFDLYSGRDRIIQPLIEELRLESRFDRPEQVVNVQGRVKVPGEYPLEPGMRVSDLIRAGGSLADSAYGGEADLARYTIVNGQERQTQLIPINLAAALRGDPKADLELQPFDVLSVKQLSLWGDQQQVTLVGQVRFPGVYTIKEGETLKSVLGRAGGLTDYAFPEGAVFTRVELKQREQQELDLLAQRTQSDITAMALQATAAGTINGQGGSAGTNALAVGQSLLTQLRATRAVGRLVIDLPKLIREPAAGSEDDVILRNGDVLMVPKYEQEVTVIGEVQSATSHLYQSGLSRDDYINQSGGMTRRADARKVYVVRANGSVVAAESNYWFFRPSLRNMAIHPGDTIVVPINTEKLPPLPEWQAITGIIYNLAVGTAAVHAVGVL
jgi:polysaccharide biosynthesis/export protein